MREWSEQYSLPLLAITLHGTYTAFRDIVVARMEIFARIIFASAVSASVSACVHIYTMARIVGVFGISPHSRPLEIAFSWIIGFAYPYAAAE